MTRQPAKGRSAVSFMAGFSSATRHAIDVRVAEMEAERDLPVPQVLHVEIESGVTTLFADCALCGESLGIAGHDDCDCPQCGEFACSSFGCGACDRKGDWDR